MPAQKTRPAGVLGALAGLVGFSAIAGILVTALVTPTLAVTSMAANASVDVFEDLPDYIAIGELSQRNVLYASKGKGDKKTYVPFATVYKENRQEISWDQLSPLIKDAVIAGEDRRFYEHGGVDLQSIVRAALGNLSQGDIGSGASTLSMQLVKNILINQALQLPTEDERKAAYQDAMEQSLDRKLKEAKLAIGLEKRYTKDEIMLAYLNIAGFGGNTYGIEAASQRYFGKSAADVTLPEAASLVAIVQLPNDRNLDREDKYQANENRRNDILDIMAQLGMITAAERDEAKATPVADYVVLTEPQSGCMYASTAKTFCDFVVKNVKNFESLGQTPEERQAAWDRGGLDVYTTLDLDAQKVAQDNINAFAPRNETRFRLGAALSAVQVGTGRILIMAQNKTFNDSAEGGGRSATAVNFNTDRDYGGSSGFPTGSTYKVFTLAEWLISGHGLSEVVNGDQREFKNFPSECTGGAWIGKYSPKNDSGSSAGPVNVVTATASSINAAYMSMAQQLDLCKIRDVAAQMGAHRADGAPLDPGPSAILGSNEQSPLAVATSVATVAGKGVYCEPIAVDHFVGRDGTEIPGQPSKCHQAIPADVAAGMAYAMSRVIYGGTGSASNPGTGTPLIGKTGTSDASVHTWMMAASTKVGAAVWVGNIVGKAQLRQYGLPRSNAATARHYIMNPVLRQLTTRYGGGNFASPPAGMMSGSTIAIPSVAGLTMEQAEDLLKGYGFQVEDAGRTNSAQTEGYAAKTTPGTGTKVSKGYLIKLYSSNGKLYVDMPNLVGQAADQAKADLVNLGFKSGNIKIQYVLAGGPGDWCRVSNHTPGAGPASKNAKVTLYVGSNAEGAAPPGPACL